MCPPIWRVATATAVLAQVGAYVAPGSLLSTPERARHDRLRQAVDRDDFVAARALARLIVLEHDGTAVDTQALRAVEFDQLCPTCGGPHGVPRVVDRSDLHVTWAHAKGVVAAAVSGEPVGVDVERVGPDPPPGIAGAGIGPWLVWTRIEAITKLGRADLETALSWSALLGHAASVDTEVELPSGVGVRLTDVVRVDLGVVCSVAR